MKNVRFNLGKSAGISTQYTQLLVFGAALVTLVLLAILLPESAPAALPQNVQGM